MTHPDSQKKLLVFISYASEDRPKARQLYNQLEMDGFDAWLDEQRLLPGQDWNLEIEKAEMASDVILLCLSRFSIQKEGYIQREIKLALKIQEEKPEGTIFVIPVRLDDCELPFSIRGLHWADYPAEYSRLRIALNFRVERRARSFNRTVTTKTDQPAESSSVVGQTFNFNASVTIQGDVVGQDKIVYSSGGQDLGIKTLAEFLFYLRSIQEQITDLKQ
jgi:hypothetical protein